MSQAGALFAVFFVQAFAAGGMFARIPDIEAATGISESALGLAFTLAALAGLVTTIISGRLVPSLGTRFLVLPGIVAVALMSAASGLAGGTLDLAAAIILGGVAFSVTNVAMNVEADRVEAATGRRIMGRCHGMWSLGMLAAAGVGVAARAAPVPPGWHLGAAALAVIAATAFLWPGYRAAPPRRPGGSKRRLAWPNRTTLIFVAFALAASVGQGGTQNWSVIFMREAFAAPDWVDTLTLPVFLGAMTLARLLGDGIAARTGPYRLGLALCATGFAGTLAVVLAPNPAVAILGFGLIGAGIGTIFPLAISATAQDPSRPAEDSMSAFILALGLAGFAGPGAMGWIAESAGFRAAFAATLPFFVMSALLARHLAPRPH